MDFLSELPLSFFLDVVDSLVGSLDEVLSFFPLSDFSSLSFLLDDVVEVSEALLEDRRRLELGAGVDRQGVGPRARHQIVTPPSTSIAWPVTKRLSSDSR